MDATLALSRAESIELCTGAVDRLARDLAIRSLFIKGPTLTAQGLRPAHSSVDVDVLVPPAQKQALLSGLERLGWHVAVPMTGSTVLPLHSSTLQHDAWMNEIDVHDRFPGFLADPAVVFEALWRRRTSVEVAGRPLLCPDVVAHGAIAALHWLRDGEGFHAEKLAFLYEALCERLDSDQRQDLVRLAEETGATGTLQPLLEALDLPVTTSRALDDTGWRIRTASTGLKSVGWVAELSSIPKRQVPGRLWHALVLTEAEIRREQPDAEPGRWGLFKARLERLRYGLRDLPKAVRIVWRERHR